MELNSSYVGTKLRPLDTVITARHAMNFAAAVTDNNARYFDDEDESALIAPPMLSVALTWPISRCFPEFMGVTDFPAEVLDYAVHFTEDLTWHRPMKQSEELTIRGTIHAILPHFGGTHLVLRYDVEDTDGNLVFTEHTATLFRGVRCTDKGQGKADILKVPRAPKNQTPLWEREVHIGPLAAHLYDGCADVHNPIHTSRDMARQVGLPGPILHGSATLALAVRELINRQADADPTRLKRLACRFTAMVPLDSKITIQLLATETTADGEDLFFEVRNQDNKRAISRGYAQIA